MRYSSVYTDEVKFTVTEYGPLAVAPAIGRPKPLSTGLDFLRLKL